VGEVREEGLVDFGGEREVDVDAAEEVVAAGGQPGFGDQTACFEGMNVVVQVVDYDLDELGREGLATGCHCGVLFKLEQESYNSYGSEAQPALYML